MEGSTVAEAQVGHVAIFAQAVASLNSCAHCLSNLGVVVGILHFLLQFGLLLPRKIAIYAFTTTFFPY
jgi:hypothetical protein